MELFLHASLDSQKYKTTVAFRIQVQIKFVAGLFISSDY